MIRKYQYLVVIGLWLTAGFASAQQVVADDVDCVRCVDGSDIAKGAVNPGKLSSYLKRLVLSSYNHHAYVSVPGAVVRPAGASSNATLLSDGSIAVAQTNDTFTIGAVQLPHGAEILGMTCSLRDPDSSGYIQASLLRHDLAAAAFPGADLIANASTFPAFNNTNFIQQSGVANANFAVVDNSAYSYYFRVDLLDATTTSNGLAFRGCTIEIAP